MEVRPGIAFMRFHGGKYHPWIVLTSPIPAKGKVVCVNLTSLDEDCVDDKCILHKADYAWIEDDHPTAVAFSYAQLYDVEKLEMTISTGKLKLAHPTDIPAKTLAKVRLIAKIALDVELQKYL